MSCLHPDTGKPGANNNTDQALVVCTPAGGPARITYYDPPDEACKGAGRGAGVPWQTRKKGGAIGELEVKR